MKTTIDTKQLSKALTTLKLITRQKSTMPILSTVLLTACDKGLRVKGSDFDVTLDVLIEGKTDRLGSICVSPRDLASALKGSKGLVTLSANGYKLEITTMTGHSTIVGVRAEEFPSLPAYPDKQIFKHGFVVGKDLKTALESVAYAINEDLTRFNLCGVCIEQNCKGQNLVATDGHRLGLAKVDIADMELGKARPIIPSLAISVLCKTVGSELLTISFSDTHFVARSEDKGFVLSTRLIDGEYPDYSPIFKMRPKLSNTIKLSDSSELIASMSRMHESTKKYKDACVELRLLPEKINLNTSCVEGSASASVAVDCSGQTLRIGASPKYLLEALQALDRSVEIHFYGELGMIEIKSGSTWAVVIPMRLPDIDIEDVSDPKVMAANAQALNARE